MVGRRQSSVASESHCGEKEIIVDHEKQYTTLISEYISK